MVPVLEPAVRMCELHAWAATRVLCSLSMVRSFWLDEMSQISVWPLSRPTLTYEPSCDHRSDVTTDLLSHKSPTSPVDAFHTYTASSSPIANKLVSDHAKRLR